MSITGVCYVSGTIGGPGTLGWESQMNEMSDFMTCTQHTSSDTSYVLHSSSGILNNSAVNLFQGKPRGEFGFDFYLI